MSFPVPKHLFFTLLVAFISGAPSSYADPHRSWSVVGGDEKRTHFSKLDQIHRGNVDQLEVAWIYRSGDLLADDNEYWGGSTIQANPIVVEDWLYTTTPTLDVVALEAATGELIWRYTPWKDKIGGGYNRGVAYWSSEDGADRRLFYTVGNELICLDAWTGKPVISFAEKGRRSMAKGLIPEHEERGGVVSPASPVIFENLVVVAGMGDWRVPGNVSAYDVMTGKRVWIFHNIPHPGEVGHDSWGDPDYWLHGFGANSWGGLSLDSEHEMVYFPVGQAKPDLHRPNPGDHLFGNSIVAVDARTGAYRWHFQEIRHDLWDMEPPGPPVLFDLEINGEVVPGLALTSKTGFTWLFNRVTGENYTQYELKEVPPSELTTEYASPVQPWVTWPEPFSRTYLKADEYSTISPEAEAFSKQRMAEADLGWLTPPNTRGILYYGVHGGAQWPGPAYDPERKMLYINANQTAWFVRMREVVASHRGAEIYSNNCMECHGWNRGGVADAPALTELNAVFDTVDSLESHLRERVNEKEGYPDLASDEFLELSEFLMDSIPDQLSHPGARLYNQGGCVECHGARRQGAGTPDRPSLLDLAPRYPEKEELKRVIREGKGAMAGNTGYTDEELTKLANFLLDIPMEPGPDDLEGPRYSTDRFERFLDSEGYPATKPPWGILNAISMETGEIQWKVPLGEFDALTARGIAPTGTENFGAPIVTQGGILFIAATMDEKIRAFDLDTGEILWEHKLPAGGYATPSTYEVNGRQYVIIPCGGGGKPGTPSGDAFVAFTLPDSYAGK